jgi:PBP1b-binding outer membrane lipoprotein LpoB
MLTIVSILGAVFLLSGCSDYNSPASQNKNNPTNIAKSEEKNIKYEIVKKDINDATTDYAKEANAKGQGFVKTAVNMPLFKEEKLKVFISGNINEETVKEAMRKIYEDEIKNDSRLDRIYVTAYDNKDYIETNSNYVTHSYWEKSDKALDENDKDTIVNGKINWSYINITKSKNFIPSNEISDQERKLFYRYWKLLSDSPTLAIADKEGREKQKQSIYEKIGKEFNITSDEVNVAVERVTKSIPSELEKQVSNALQKRFDARTDRGEYSSDANEKADELVIAKEFKISLDDVDAMYAHVAIWESPLK